MSYLVNNPTNAAGSASAGRTQAPAQTTLTPNQGNGQQTQIPPVPDSSSTTAFPPLGTPQPKVGQKRKTGHDLIEPAPMGGIRYNFVTGKEVAPKKPRIGEAPPSASHVDADGDQPMTAEEKRKQLQAEKEKREASIKAFKDKYARDTQKKETGAIRWIQQHHPRYTDYQSWSTMAIDFGPTADLLLKQMEKQTEDWVWVQVYKNPTPNATHVELFGKAMAKIEGWKSEPGFHAGDYHPMLIKKSNGNTAPTILVSCDTKDAKTRLLKLGSFAYVMEEREVAFFVQGPTACGNALVLEFYNAPASEEHLIRGAFLALKEVILWKENSEEKSEAVAFRFAKLDTSIGRGSRWLVAVKPDFDVIASGWQYPEQAGDYGSTGEIQIKKPEWCKHCVSWSHEERYCEWWRESTVTSTTVAPPNFVHLQWKDHTTFTFRKEKDDDGKEKVQVATTKATNHPSLPDPLFGRARGSGRGGFGRGTGTPRGFPPRVRGGGSR